MASNAEPAGEVRADGIYTLVEIEKRLGLGRAALRTARRRGLKVRRAGRRDLILGRDLLNYLGAAPVVETPTPVN